LTFVGRAAVKVDPAKGSVMRGLRHYGYNGISRKIRKERRQLRRWTEGILRSQGWQTIDGRPEYVGKSHPEVAVGAAA